MKYNILLKYYRILRLFKGIFETSNAQIASATTINYKHHISFLNFGELLLDFWSSKGERKRGENTRTLKKLRRLKEKKKIKAQSHSRIPS